MYSYNSPAVIGAEQISLPEDVSDSRSSSLHSVVTVQSVFGDDEASQNKIIKQQRCLVNVTKQHPRETSALTRGSVQYKRPCLRLILSNMNIKMLAAIRSFRYKTGNKLGHRAHA